MVQFMILLWTHVRTYFCSRLSSFAFGCTTRIVGSALITWFAAGYSSPSVAQSLVETDALIPDLKTTRWIVNPIVNGRAFASILAVESGGHWWVAREAYLEWGVNVDDIERLPKLVYSGQTFFDVAASGAQSFVFDEANLTLTLMWPASAYSGSGSLSLASFIGLAKPKNVPIAGFLNYQFNADKDGKLKPLFSGEFELGISGSVGLLTSEFVARNGFQSGVFRTKTAFRMDWPESSKSLIFGDSEGRPGLWGVPVLFGGIHYFSNFSLQPGYVNYPSPRYEGSAVVPSVVSVFLNQRRPLSIPVQPGPFSVADLYTTTGTNEVAFVVRDALGRETVTKQTFYSFQELLRPGLHDFSYELGATRRDVGIDSFGYQKIMAVAQSKYGVSDTFTTELRAQLYGKAAAAGIGAVWATPLNFGLIATAAASRSANKTGVLTTLGLQKRELLWSVGANVRLSTLGFTQADQQSDGSAQRLGWSAFASRDISEWGALSILAASTQGFDGTGSKSAILQWAKSMQLGGQITASAGFSRSGDRRVSSVGVSVRFPLSRTLSVASALNYGADGAASATASVSQAVPQGLGYGWSLFARTRRAAETGVSDTSGLARLFLRQSSTEVDAQAAYERGVLSARTTFAGAVGLIDGTSFTSRRIQDGFGLIRVTGWDDVSLQRNGVVFARTDQRGTAVFPRLTPYSNNVIGVDVRSLPLEVEPESLEINLIAPYRGGAVGSFKLTRSVAALVRIELENGEPPPRGSSAYRERSSPDEESFVVGSDGAAYLTKLQPRNRFYLVGVEGRCSFDVVVPEERFDTRRTFNSVLRLGKVVCKELTQ